MGFIKNTRLRKFEFKHFGLSHSSDDPLPGHDEMQVHNPSTNAPVTKYIERYDALEGFVTDCEWYDRKDNAGQRYVGYSLVVDVGEEVINLDFPYGKPAYRILTRHGRNVDWAKQVKFSAWKTQTPQGKDMTGVCFWQVGDDGKEMTIKSAHTKENPNGCPEPKESVKGLNWDEVERWLKAQFDANVLPAIKAAAKDRVSEKPLAMSASAAAFAAQAPSSADDGDDTIPF